MATMPSLENGVVVNKSHWNAHANQINDNTNAVAAMDTRVTTLESYGAAGSFYGQWTDINDRNDPSTPFQSVNTEAGEKITQITTPVGNSVGCSMSGGTVTLHQTGWWEIVVSAQYTGGTAVRALWVSKSSTTSGSGLAKYGALAGPSMDAQSTSAVIHFNAGDVFSAYAAIWQGGDPVDIWRAGGNNITCVWLGA